LNIEQTHSQTSKVHQSPTLHQDLGLSSDRPYFKNFSPLGLPSPCFVVDRAAITYNLKILADIGQKSGATILAALKAFSFYEVFDLVEQYLSGACASGIHEARLAREKINKEVHVFAPAYKPEEVTELLLLADHLVFNNLHQWLRYQDQCLDAKKSRPQLSFGIRINPEHSEGAVPIYDPCAPGSRLGITRSQWNRELAIASQKGKSPQEVLQGITGIHFHTLCEQGAEPLERTLAAIEQTWGDVLNLDQITWLNMGGGHHITKPDYNRDLLIQLIRQTRERFNLQIYLEPGEAVAIHTGILATRVVDIHENPFPIVILDTSATCHMPDTLEMPYTPQVWGAQPIQRISFGTPGYRLAGQTCLAGDVIADYKFLEPLEIGDWVIFDDMAHYTMVKTTTFNGIPLPSLAVYDSATGVSKIVKTFSYEDFASRLS